MFGKNANDKKEKIRNYINFLIKKIVDEILIDEIVEEINKFSKHGSFFIQESNLYGRINNNEGNDYIAIKCTDKSVVCNYTKWSGSSNINICQTKLKNGNIKVSREEKIDYIHPLDKNSTRRKYNEKIYNDKDFLIYKSEISENEEYDSYSEQLIYNNSSVFDNKLEIEKNWYFIDGTIINYKLKKQNYDFTKFEESYSICEKPYEDDIAIYYNFNGLDRELFSQFMTGQIDLESLILQNKEKQKQIVKEAIKLK